MLCATVQVVNKLERMMSWWIRCIIRHGQKKEESLWEALLCATVQVVNKLERMTSWWIRCIIRHGQKRKKAYEKLCFVHCATVQVVNFVFLATKCPRMIYRSPKKKYHKEQTLPKAQRTWELSAFARVLCPNRPGTNYLWALTKKQRGAKSGKVFVKLLRCWNHENSRICGSNYRPDNISIQFNLIVSPTGET